MAAGRAAARDPCGRCEPRVKRLSREIDTMIDIQRLEGEVQVFRNGWSLWDAEAARASQSSDKLYLDISSFFFLSSVTKVRRGSEAGAGGRRLL